MTPTEWAALGGALVGVVGCIVYLTTYHLWQARYLAAKRQLLEDWIAIKRASGRWEPVLERTQQLVQIFCTVAFAITLLVVLPLLAVTSWIVSAGNRAASLPVVGERVKTASQHVAFGFIILLIVLTCALFPAILVLILMSPLGAEIAAGVAFVSYVLGSLGLAATLIPTLGDVLARRLRLGFFGYIVTSIVVWGTVVYGLRALLDHLPDTTKPLPWFRTAPGP
jgi:hypothetical protein